MKMFYVLFSKQTNVPIETGEMQLNKNRVLTSALNYFRHFHSSE